LNKPAEKVVIDAIQGITDDDRKMIINKSLRKVNSALSVR
jgi:hypothetical protein